VFHVITQVFVHNVTLPNIYHQTNANNAHTTVAHVPTQHTVSTHAQRTTITLLPQVNVYQTELKELL
jgi:hypothetical protein